MLLAILALQAPVAKITLAAIDEGSGIVASRRYPGVLWTHNDSGDSARFFAIKADGTAVVPAWYNRREDAGQTSPRPPFEGIKVELAQNIDWEDIAYDGETIYLADVGNNGNARRDLGVYAVPEPNPAETEKTRPIAWFPIAYPEQNSYPPTEGDKAWDCEAVFHLRNKLYFLTKTRTDKGIPKGVSRLYRMDTEFTDKPNHLRFLDIKSDFGGWVTGADASPDGKTLAVLTHFPQAAVWLFDARAGGDKFLSKPLKTIPLTNAGQCEAVCFEADGKSLLVTNEGRDIFRVVLSQ